ncbi:MAG: PQQ-dependent sugar dehydrogenase [Anaerolineales bacterium]
MKQTISVFAVGLAVLACALPFTATQDAITSPTEPAAATTAAATSPATDSPTASPAATSAPSPEPANQADITSMPDPASANWQPVITGLSKPLGLEHADDARLFILEQAGLIGIYQQGQLLAEPFLDIRDRVVDSGLEQGLLGMAFHPDFSDNGYFYINYTGSGGNTRISRFSLSGNPNVADPDSEQVLITIQQPFANHNGGGLAFGPDGYLYIGTGDGGSAGDPQGNAQSLDTLLGKLLRINVDGDDGYAIPADNPFAESAEARSEIWDYGLRNPWRFDFDPQTGDLYIADVGQNQWEEVNFEPAGSSGGLNYGWDLYEASHPFEGDGANTVMPVAEYSHEFGCSITGGVVVRSPSLPDWNGVYLYADYCSGNLWGLIQDDSGQWQSELLQQTDFRPSAFGTDANGEVYLLDHDGGLYRLTPTD